MNTFKARLAFLGILLSLALGVVATRLFQIQVLKGEQYAARSREQSTGRKVVKALRGTIRDRSGQVLAANLPGATPRGSESAARIYPHGELAGAVLGYVGRDGYGLGGCELAFDKYLRGEDGWAMQQRDGRNVRYNRIGQPRKDPRNGSDVYLTIDLRIQKIVQNVLEQTTAALGARAGTCIVMEPRTGRILAMANAPGFDPNHAERYPLEARANPCIAYNYEPGSTFKVIPAASVLEEKVLRESDTLDGNNGSFVVYDQVIRDHKPFGRITFQEALAQSSNVCFARIANSLGSERLYKYTLDFGLGAQTGIRLPGEETGVVHPTSRWSGRTRVTMAIGQEVSATFLQMVLVFATIANDGVLLEPRIHEQVALPDGTERDLDKPKPVRRVVSKDVTRRLREMLKAVVDDGTGRLARIPGVDVGGKTGTSQKYDKETGQYSSERLWASFIGFAPVDEPVLVCGVMVDEPTAATTGGAAAAPAFRGVIQQIISHPELEFAEKILRHQGADTATIKSVGMPLICGLDRSRADALLRSLALDFEILGSGDTVLYQSPLAGELLADDGRLLAYTSRFTGGQSAEGVLVPNCVGKDLRDAVNAVNLKGLVPFVEGAGTVRRQYPTVGALVRAAAACTLYCSFEG